MPLALAGGRWARPYRSRSVRLFCFHHCAGWTLSLLESPVLLIPKAFYLFYYRGLAAVGRDRQEADRTGSISLTGADRSSKPLSVTTMSSSSMKKP